MSASRLAELTRSERRKTNRDNGKRGVEFAEIPEDAWPVRPPNLIRAWVNNRFMAQLYAEDGALRLSVSRVKISGGGRWEDGITWDELQEVKRAVGYGQCCAVEIFPADRDLVNVANIRHLWFPNQPLKFGWVS